MWKKTNPSDPDYVRKFWIALLLCLFFGPLGLHRFYTGYGREGRIFLLCAFTGIGTAVSGLWALFDLAMILCRLYATPNGRALE